ncbi:MAG: adenylate/guanylate cyclase domain-containing protein [Verrucomicrobia bacterium]|nr:adenylate/guanylate cyclase domain-containing protein [Verrucomicrobiota bacterium]
MKKRRKLIHGALIGIVSALISLAVWSMGVLDGWENTTWDMRARMFADKTPECDRIKLILLDQPSLDWGERETGLSWPWPRQVYAPIIKFCKDNGARVIAFDVLFTEPSVYGVDDDDMLGSAIAESGCFVGAIYVSDGETATVPIPQVATNVQILGNVKELPDADGVFRRINVRSELDGEKVPSLGLAAYAVGSKTGPSPDDVESERILRYRAADAFETFSAAAVMQSEVRIQEGGNPVIEDAGSFQDSYVLFGFSAPGLKDLRPTPVNRAAPGVEIHATLLENILSGHHVRRMSRLPVVLTVLLLSLICALLSVFSKRVLHNIVVLLVLLPVPWVLGFVHYRMDFWWPIMVTELGVVLSLGISLVVNYATEGRQKAFIKTAFRHYLSSEVIERIIEDPSQLKLGGERKQLTIFFSDLEKFSSFSEKLEADVLIGLLNDYLTLMTDIIRDHGGTVDKYIGDAIVAFWNAPLSRLDHARAACLAAVACQKSLAEERPRFSREYGVDLRMRIGVNTGEVAVGNMGSRDRFDYSILGDAANLASRLEGANKFFGTYTMVSEAAWSLGGGDLPGRSLGRLVVVGRKTPVAVYELLSEAWDEERRGHYEEGLRLCSERNWEKALREFKACADDPVAGKFAMICRELVEGRRSDWDGIWLLDSK